MRIITGELRGRMLKTAKGASYRPAMSKVRQAVFSMLVARWGGLAGARVLDLFAGTASLAFEALSRGATLATCVDNDETAVQTMRANARLLGLLPQRVRIVKEDVRRFLAKTPAESYNLVFVDPPYAFNALPGVLTALAENRWLSFEAIVCAELEKGGRPFVQEALPAGFFLETEKTYGQTRLVLLNFGASHDPSGE